ncbi:hypothetical protein FRB95_014235 [Tulasnella sp. JGI-2019a]|nr:hypothetical protein FRB93_007074 [Tulasnella sp. JGI-2019a]KAG9022756.1 hypothetical protein FRB95_014235 [Tulasnella sp. JGI-2019a]
MTFPIESSLENPERLEDLAALASGSSMPSGRSIGPTYRLPPTRSHRNGHRLRPLDSGDPLAGKVRSRTRTIIAVDVRLLNGHGKSISNPSDDLWLFINQDLQGALHDESAIIYFLTEVLDLDWLGDFNATIVHGVPTRENVKLAIEGAALQCAPGGRCLLWICCNGTAQKLSNGREISVLIPSDGSKQALTGNEIKSWASTMHSSSTLTVLLEVCYSGNFMNLPYEFATDGKLVALRRSRVAALKGPRIVCISACRKDEVAYLGRMGDKMCGAFTLMLKSLVHERSRKGRPNIYLRDIERFIAPELDRWGGQHPVVSMSHADHDALYSLL